MGWVGLGHTKWTHGQLCADRRAAAALLLQLSAGRAAIRACERSGERRNVRSPLTPVSITPLTAPLRSHAPAAIDRYLLPAELTTANPPHAAAAVDSCGRQTDGHPTVTQTRVRILCGRRRYRLLSVNAHENKTLQSISAACGHAVHLSGIHN